MSDFEQLLVVQGHDTRIRQLEHELEALPARTQAAQARRRLDALAQEKVPIEAQRADLKRQQSLLEDEVTLVENKTDRENNRLYSGEVTGIKELQAIQDEIASLGRHRETLEDKILAIMEQAEPVDAHLEQFAEAATTTEASLAEAEADIAKQSERIDGELAAEAAQRSDAASEVTDTDLLATYDTKRAELGGVGVARFTGALCEGCHLSMSAMEVDQIKKQPADALVICSSCERILVR